MSYENLLTDRCDIYHLKERPAGGGGGYGVPVGDRQQEHYYDADPDEQNIKCLFVEKNQTVVQQEPNQKIIEAHLVHFLVASDIRINDKVIWDGVVFKARKPRNIRNHHKEVTLIRDESL